MGSIFGTDLSVCTEGAARSACQVCGPSGADSLNPTDHRSCVHGAWAFVCPPSNSISRSPGVLAGSNITLSASPTVSHGFFLEGDLQAKESRQYHSPDTSHSRGVAGQLVVQGAPSASASSLEVMKYECILTQSHTCVPPEPQRCKHLPVLGCEVPLEKRVILCGTLASAHHTSDMTDGTARGACASACALLVCTGPPRCCTEGAGPLRCGSQTLL